MTMPSPANSPDVLAAHDLLSELRTRMATQPLPYQHGVESRALESLWEVFGLARKAMKDHPGCAEFAQRTTKMLNLDLRPVTAKWHRAYEAGVLSSRDGANEFRVDLAALRVKLLAFALDLQEMAYGSRIQDDVTPDVIDASEIERCFEHAHFGIGGNVPPGVKNAKSIDADEAAEIKARRAKYLINTPEGVDAVGVGLSGGGMKSATFCLGVLQVLAERGLLKDVDFLSTVSGGGYTGSFITSRIGGGKDFSAIANPGGPDTAAVRHVRQNAKYLSAVDLKQRWLMVTGTMAGLMLNWMAPLGILAVMAILFNRLKIDANIWALVTAALAVATSAAVIVYGVFLRFGGAGARNGGRVLAWGAGLTLAGLVLFCVESGYVWFLQDAATNWSRSALISLSGLSTSLIVAGPVVVRYLPVFQNHTVKKIMFKTALMAAGLIIPFLAIVTFYLFRKLGSPEFALNASVWNPAHYVSGEFLLVTIAVVSVIFSGWLLNVNLTGPHKLYRDRLAAAFVQSTRNAPDLPLHEVNSARGAPYHLINATLNLPSSTSPTLRDRKGDFFLFSKCWSGAGSIGYYPTSEWRANSGKVDLATAMAISGAAASPHMGLRSMPTLSAVLTLLNIRLGFWIAKPKSGANRVPGFVCLLKEMTGIGMAENDRWLNLSDGGHIENMGMYELLRRRCKFIVCIDGESDPQSTFEGQMTLVRHAQVDFGIRIEPRLDDIRPNLSSKFSRTHSHLFRIHYPAEGDRPKAIGLMLYLKVSLTGDEAELLKRYRTIHPDFPHQSTLDQFYDEEQFEAYRQLGVHVAEGTFSGALLTEDTNPTKISNWFRQLAANMLEPDPAGSAVVPRH